MSALSLLSDFMPQPDPTPPPAPQTPGPEAQLEGLAGIDLLIRAPHRFLKDMDRLGHPEGAVRMLLVTTAIAAAAIGVSVGAWHGGLQLLLAALKLPAAELLTAVLCAPALTALNIAIQGRSSLRQDFALILTALAFGTLIAAALSPLLLLAAIRHFEYHRTIVLLVGICVMGGSMGLSIFLAGMRQESVEGRRIVSAVMLTVIMLVAAQMVWIARPYVGVPGTRTPIVRRVDGDFLPAVTQVIRTVLTWDAR